MFMFPTVLLWCKFRPYLREYGPKNIPKRAISWMLNKYAKLKLTSSNAIRIKLTLIIYLHENINLKPLRARNSVLWRNVYEFLDYIRNHQICHALT